ncbi:MAG: aconitate hydratase, partial [Pseudobdellovibrionaceae bacterium]
PVFLNDIFPTSEEVELFVHKNVTLDKFKSSYGDVFKGSSEWQAIKVEGGDLYKWDAKSTYIKEPPYFDGLEKRPTAVKDFNKGRALLVVGDSVTTDHISPAGDIGKNSVAGEYLGTLGIKKEDFNSYGARRGNHEIMIRGTFANVRIKNKMIAPKEGPMTMYIPSGEVLPVATVAEMYRKDGTPLLVLGGKEYGSGSSRDWAAKGPALQGVRVAIAESYERIHRSNLIGMGILPLQFMPGESVESLGLTGFETFDITGLSGTKVRDVLTVNYTTKDGQKKSFKAQSRIDTPNELAYYQNGGILQYVLRDIGASI